MAENMDKEKYNVEANLLAYEIFKLKRQLEINKVNLGFLEENFNKMTERNSTKDSILRDVNRKYIKEITYVNSKDFEESSRRLKEYKKFSLDEQKELFTGFLKPEFDGIEQKLKHKENEFKKLHESMFKKEEISDTKDMTEHLKAEEPPVPVFGKKNREEQSAIKTDEFKFLKDEFATENIAIDIETLKKIDKLQYDYWMGKEIRFLENNPKFIKELSKEKSFSLSIRERYKKLLKLTDKEKEYYIGVKLKISSEDLAKCRKAKEALIEKLKRAKELLKAEIEKISEEIKKLEEEYKNATPERKEEIDELLRKNKEKLGKLSKQYEEVLNQLGEKSPKIVEKNESGNKGTIEKVEDENKKHREVLDTENYKTAPKITPQGKQEAKEEIKSDNNPGVIVGQNGIPSNVGAMSRAPITVSPVPLAPSISEKKNLWDRISERFKKQHEQTESVSNVKKISSNIKTICEEELKEDRIYQRSNFPRARIEGEYFYYTIEKDNKMLYVKEPLDEIDCSKEAVLKEIIKIQNDWKKRDINEAPMADRKAAQKFINKKPTEILNAYLGVSIGKARKRKLQEIMCGMIAASSPLEKIDAANWGIMRDMGLEDELIKSIKEGTRVLVKQKEHEKAEEINVSRRDEIRERTKIPTRTGPPRPDTRRPALSLEKIEERKKLKEEQAKNYNNSRKRWLDNKSEIGEK